MRKLLPIALLFLLLQSVGYCTTIGEAKALPVDTPVTVQGVVTYLETQECYIQSADAPTGIWVSGAMDLVSLNDVVDAVGTIAVINGEKAISNAVVTKTGQTKTISPVSMVNKSITGASLESTLPVWDYLKVKNNQGVWEWKWLKAGGANNTGLFVRTWGTVKATYYSPTNNVKWFYMDDGSGVVSDLGDTGVLVYSDAKVHEGDVVSVNGVSSTEPSMNDSSKLVRVIRPARASDVQIEKEYQPPQPPFSDEFNRTTMSRFWYPTYDSSIGGKVDAAREPGWIALDAPTSSDSAGHYTRTELVQACVGSWDLEVKVRCVFDPNPTQDTSQDFWICLMRDFSITGSESWSETSWLAGFANDLANGRCIYQCYYDGCDIACSRTPLAGDTAYFRIRHRSPNLYVSTSVDGLNYTDETTVPDQGNGYFGFYAKSTGTAVQFTAYIDYCRFTRVTE